MNEAEKTAWVDEENKIVSFHAIDNGEKVIKTESLFWTDERRIPGHVKGERKGTEKNEQKQRKESSPHTFCHRDSAFGGGGSADLPGRRSGSFLC